MPRMFKSLEEAQQYEKDEKRKDKTLEYQETQGIHELFKHYRQSGIAFSATLISICSALIAWLTKILDSQPQGWENILIWSQLILLVLIISFSLLIQYFHYQGYKHLAKSCFKQSTSEISNKFFSQQDSSLNISGILFIIQLVILTLFFIGKFK